MAVFDHRLAARRLPRPLGLEPIMAIVFGNLRAGRHRESPGIRRGCRDRRKGSISSFTGTQLANRQDHGRSAREPRSLEAALH
jgi:hypothetical protein